MHELPVTQSIIRIAREEAEKHKVNKVLEIRIAVGELTGLMPNCIQHYFDIASRGTVVEGAKLIINKVPVAVRCNNCNSESEIDKSKSYGCPVCGHSDIKIIRGNEFLIQSLEVE
ncbi:hydrogenase maturation nickel metallochaperone HypA [Clostridium thermarum]|uniref:hydrogenase maturation nickel metallochaperone HypA n=1 Tax=Clostridium thermarum TaxID=1716543 RepID=UPI0013CFEEF3|nr:hydrogenase maturation nickel metallochaperone HypA [Clostridium thermarum]